MQVVRDRGHTAVLPKCGHIGNAQGQYDADDQYGRQKLVKREALLCLDFHEANYSGSFPLVLSEPTNGARVPINGQNTPFRFNLIRTRIEITVGSVTCDTRSPRVTDDKRLRGYSPCRMAEHKGAVGRTKKRRPERESLAIGSNSNAVSNLVSAQDALAWVDPRGRISITVFEHEPTIRPVTARRTLLAVKTGTQGDDFATHNRLLAREMNGVEQGVDFCTLPLTCEGIGKIWYGEARQNSDNEQCQYELEQSKPLIFNIH